MSSPSPKRLKEKRNRKARINLKKEARKSL